MKNTNNTKQTPTEHRHRPISVSPNIFTPRRVELTVSESFTVCHVDANLKKSSTQSTAANPTIFLVKKSNAYFCHTFNKLHFLIYQIIALTVKGENFIISYAKLMWWVGRHRRSVGTQ